MAKMKRIVKIAACVVALFAVIGFCVWMAIANRQQSGVPPEQAMKDENGNILTGPNGEMFFEYSEVPGTAKEKQDEDTKETHYYLSGVWRWNDEISAYPGMHPNEKKTVGIRFNSVRAKETSLIFHQYDEQFFCLSYSAERANHGYGDGYGWLDPTEQIIDLGVDPQRVDKELYEYFLANATPSSEAEYMTAVEQYLWEAKVKVEEYTVDGYWKWNEEIVFVTSEQHVEMRLAGSFSHGQSFYKFSIGRLGKSGTLVVMYSNSVDAAANRECWNEARGGWVHEDMRYIFLGEEPQTLSGDDYYWFIANATPCTKEEYDAIAELFQPASE